MANDPYAVITDVSESEVSIEVRNSFSVKDKLKERGYSYGNRVWYKVLPTKMAQMEAYWLQSRAGIPVTEGIPLTDADKASRDQFLAELRVVCDRYHDTAAEPLVRRVRRFIAEQEGKK
jgi:hypothetical protein